MPWPATSRYGMVPAPGALGLAQDLLNTAPAAHEPDLLADLASARKWVSEATAEWSAATGRPVPEVMLDADGLQELRAFRGDLREVITPAHDAAPDTGPAVQAVYRCDRRARQVPGSMMRRCGPEPSGRLEGEGRK
jgi:hypothetical protein